MTPEQVEECLEVGREALVLLAALAVSGTRTRAEVYGRARVEADALISLLDEAPELEAVRIHQLLDRYDTFMAALVN